MPYRVHTVLTDNGIQFTKKPGTEAYRAHPFDALCQRHGIEHRLTQPFHSWTNGQVERMNRTIDDQGGHDQGVSLHPAREAPVASPRLPLGV